MSLGRRDFRCPEFAKLICNRKRYEMGLTMITKPAVPQVPPQLDVWSENTQAELELDRVLVRNVDFTAAAKLSVDSSRLENVITTAAVVEALELTDVECVKLEGSALRAYQAKFLRVTMNNCRLTGAEFAEGQFEDCSFKNIQFDEVGFRFATFKRVRFEDCVLRHADFSSAKLSHVTFTNCEVEGANFDSASCQNVDVTRQNLVGAKGVLGLKGATISLEQLGQLAPLLASELGFRVEDDS